MLHAGGCCVVALAIVVLIAEDLVGVIELAVLPAHTLHTPLPEPDVPTHAGRAGGWGGWVAQEAPLPAQVEGTCAGGAFVLGHTGYFDEFALVSCFDGVDVEAVALEISTGNDDDFRSDCQ